MPAKKRYKSMTDLVKNGSARNIDALRMDRPPRKFFSHNVDELDIVEEAENLVREVVRDVETYAARTWDLEPPTDIKFGWEHWRSRSRGGCYEAVRRSRLNDEPLSRGPGINMCMKRRVPTVDTADLVTYDEYKRMAPWGMFRPKC